MADLLAIISKTHFEGSGTVPNVGDHLRIDRYSSANKALKPLGDGGRLFLVTVRPPELLWLVGVLDEPKFDGQEWVAPVASNLAITDITKLRDRLRFASGKGIPSAGSLGASLQTPRALSAQDVVLLEAAVTAAPAPEVVDDEPAQLRRVDDRESLAHRIERSKSARAKCATCELAIGKGDVRVAEVYQHGDLRNPIFRFHHLDCAVTAVPLVVRPALRVLDDATLVPDRDAITARIDARLAELAAEKRTRYAARTATPAADAPASAASSDLFAQLADDPDDAATLAVLADELVAHGDPRGELITVMLALARAPNGELVQRRDELLGQLAPRIDAVDRAVWSVGFIRRLELRGKSATRIDEMASVWSHPSLAFLRELSVELDSPRDGPDAIACLATTAPRTLERLELGELSAQAFPAVVQLVEALPKLRVLAVGGRGDLGSLAHPSLGRLELTAGPEAAMTGFVASLDPARLPAITALALIGAYDYDATALCEAVAARGWLPRLRQLEIRRYKLGPDAIAHLARGLGKHKLVKLDVATCTVELRRRPDLAALCSELAFPAAAVAAAAAEATHVEHTAKPEWGIGKIVSRKDGKLEVKFPKAGVKVFRADAAFLKLT